MSGTVTVDGTEYNVEDLTEAGKSAINGYLHAQRKMDVAKVDFEMAIAAREHFGSLLKATLEMEVVDDTTGTES